MWYFVLCYLVAIAHYGQGSCPPKYGDAIDTPNGRWYVAGRHAFGDSVTRDWGKVTHMEDDRLDGNRILFSDAYHIGTTYKNLSEVSVVAGAYGRPGHVSGNSSQVRFNGISGFTQLLTRPILIMIADSKNHCIRRLSREDGVIEIDDYSGRCTESGFVNGRSGSTRYKNPTAVLHWPRDSNNIYIADSGNNAVRLLTVNNGATSTLSIYHGRPGFNYIIPYDDSFIITSPSGLLVYNISRDNWTNLIEAQNLAAILDGSFSVARLGNPFEITKMLDLNIYALADKGSLRFLDFVNNKLTTACSGLEPTLHAMLFVDARLYIGIGNSIAYIKVVKGIEALPSPPPTTTTIKPTRKTTPTTTVVKTTKAKPTTTRRPLRKTTPITTGTGVTCTATTAMTVILHLLCLSAIRMSGMLHL